MTCKNNNVVLDSNGAKADAGERDRRVKMATEKMGENSLFPRERE